MSGAPLNIHGSTVVVGERGLLIRGPSGSGKTCLALALVDDARKRGGFARLVADDRTLVAWHGGRLVARPHPALAGRVERRGLGLATLEHEAACLVVLVVDFVEDEPERMPGSAARRCEIAGVTLPRVSVRMGSALPEASALVQAALTMSGPVP